MLGFAIVDRQPSSESAAVWLTSRVEDSGEDASDELKSVRVAHTNAVVIAGDDERYETMIRALTADRAVVLTEGTIPPVPFAAAISVDAFDRLIEATRVHQRRIVDAVATVRKSSKRQLVDPDFPRVVPELISGDYDRPECRALVTANYVAAVWRFWLLTDAQRARRSVPTKTKKGELPPIMPQELCDPKLTELPPEFTETVTLEPLTR